MLHTTALIQMPEHVAIYRKKKFFANKSSCVQTDILAPEEHRFSIGLNAINVFSLALDTYKYTNNIVQF